MGKIAALGIVAVIAAVLLCGWLLGSDPRPTGTPPIGAAGEREVTQTEIESAELAPADMRQEEEASLSSRVSIDDPPRAQEPVEEPATPPRDGVQVSVLAAGTLHPLQGIEVRRRKLAIRGSGLLPTGTPVDRIVRSATSPVLLPGPDVRGYYWVRAPGYAWRGFPVFSSSGQLEILLEPSCSLRVILHGYEAEFGGYLMLTRSGDTFLGSNRAEVEIGSASTLQLDDLPPGSYTVQVAVGEPSNPVLLGEGRVELHGGDVEELIIEVQPPSSDLEKVPLSGVLVPAEGASGALFVRLTPVDPDLARRQEQLRFRTETDAPATGEVAFDLGLVLPGEYRVDLSPFGGQFLFSLGPDGDRNARFEYPALHEVRVRLIGVEEAPETIQLGAHFYWRDQEFGGYAEVPYDGDLGLHRTALPVGEFELDALLDLPRGSERFTVGPGLNEYEVELQPLSMVDIEVEGGRGQPMMLGWGLARAIGPDGLTYTASSLLTGEHGTLLLFPVDGPCRLDLREVGEALAELDAVEVFLRRGEVVKVTVELPTD